MLAHVFACPRCSARLVPGPAWSCSDCGQGYPVLAGVPILVPDPSGYLGSHRDAVLAALAEHGLASPEVVLEVIAWSAAGEEPRSFGDDWVEDEELGPLPPPGDGPHHAAWAAFAEGVDPLHEVLADLVDGERVLELGCGSGVLSERLARPGLVVADLSLRAVLRATAAAGCPGAVVDGDFLALVPASLDALVAANLWDLLHSPQRLAEAAAIALDEGGALVLCTPDPEDLDAHLAAQGLTLDVDREAVPWLRSHDPRESQVYWVRVVRARAD